MVEPDTYGHDEVSNEGQRDVKNGDQDKIISHSDHVVCDSINHQFTRVREEKTRYDPEQGKLLDLLGGKLL